MIIGQMQIEAEVPKTFWPFWSCFWKLCIGGTFLGPNKLSDIVGCWKEAPLTAILTALYTLTIEVRGVAVSWAGVSQGSEVRHHVTSSATVNGWTRRQQDNEVEELEDIWPRLVDRQQDQAVSPGQAGQCDHQVVGREAVQTWRGLVQNQNT